MKYFDARIVYGAAFGEAPPKQSLSDTLTECQCDNAVVLMRESENVPVDLSYPLTDRRLEATPNAYGLYLMVPSCTGEVPPVGIMARDFAAKRIAGFSYIPPVLNMRPEPINFTDELSACERLSIPVWCYIQFDKVHFTALTDMLAAYPKLTLIYSSVEEWPNTRKLYPLMKAYPNLMLCMAEFMWLGGIEDFCSKFGAERLLYSSSWPARYPGSAKLMLQNADISLREKELIAHGNMERIIGGIRHD